MNHLITNALEHIPDCLVYLSSIKDKDNFNFCAIPQVMAIATMAACYNNGDVFRGVVKIRRGEACYVSSTIVVGCRRQFLFYVDWVINSMSDLFECEERASGDASTVPLLRFGN